MCLYCDVDTQPRFCFVFLQGASVSKSTPLQKRRKVFKEPQSEASKIKKSLLVSHLDTIILIVCVIRSFSTTAMCIHSGRHRSRSFSRSWSRSRSRSPTPRHSRRGGHRDHRDAVSRSRSRSFSRWRVWPFLALKPSSQAHSDTVMTWSLFSFRSPSRGSYNRTPSRSRSHSYSCSPSPGRD